MKSEWSSKSLDERVKALGDVFVEHDQIRAVFEAIENKGNLIRCKGRAALELGEGLLVVAPSGGGKTRLVRAIIERYENKVLPERTVLNSVSFELHGVADRKHLSIELLRAMGHRDISGPEGDLFERVFSIGAKCFSPGAIILIDNFQDIPARRGARGTQHALDWARSIVDRLPVVLVALGTDEAQVAVASWDQLDTRMRPIIHLHPYVAELKVPDPESTDLEACAAARVALQKALKRYQAYLKALDQELPFPEMLGLSRKEFVSRLVCATSANGRITRKLLEALLMLVENRDRKIPDLDDWSDAFRSLAAGPDVADPFVENFEIGKAFLAWRAKHALPSKERPARKPRR